MDPISKNLVWSLDLPPPWRSRDVDDYVEITQPEGAGVMHIRCARKKEGMVSDAEALEHLKKNCAVNTGCEKMRCGDFVGYVADYVDWTTSRFWRVWFVACGEDLLHITYTCWRGEEELESEDASALLRLLRSRA
jgi:hypothetical protein